MAVDVKRVQAVFLAVLRAADPSAQETLLNRECCTDPELRRHVESLLQAYRKSGGEPDPSGATLEFTAAAVAQVDSDDNRPEPASEPVEPLRDRPASDCLTEIRETPLPEPNGVAMPGPPRPNPLPLVLDPNSTWCADGRVLLPTPPGNPLPLRVPVPTDAINARPTGAVAAGANANETCLLDQRAAAHTLIKDQLTPGAGAPDAVVVPGYKILEELGRGGMGVVYKARHLRLQRLVALKMILAGAHAGAAGLARFRAEAEAVAQLQHPNIVQIYETGEHEGRPYFSLEFVEGGSLEQRMREAPTPPRAAAELIETLARTMEVAHHRGIVHRDLKPGNILLQGVRKEGSGVKGRGPGGHASSLTPDPSPLAPIPKIADFGLAKRIDDDSSQTQSGSILGTPCYMAPEQAEGKNREIGPPADVYSLGAILYELLVGRPPFKAGSPIDTIRQVIDQEPVPPRQLEPRVPHDLETICLKCLEKNPARRYASGGELASDLRRFLNGEPIHARPTPAWERAWKWGKRRPTAVALLGVSLLAVAAMVLLIVWHNVSLRGQLDEALAEERLARQREQEAVESQRLSQLHHQAQKLLADARLAAAARDWPTARLHLTKTLTAIGNEPKLHDLQVPAQDLLKQVVHELHTEADRQASHARFQQFGKLREEAQFLGTLYTGMDLAANLDATRTTVQQALAVYKISVDKSAPGRAPEFDVYLNGSQKAEVLGDCYQLVLILAETAAQAKPTAPPNERAYQLREAVRLLQQALRFGAPSRAWHLRQARYLGLLNDRAGAQRAEKAAQGAAFRHVLDHFLVADELYRRGKFDEAIQEFNQVLEREPAHFWAQFLSAQCLLRQHRSAEARAQLSACLAQRSEFVWLYLLRGFAQTELKAFAAADADFQKAAQMPLDDDARYVLLVQRGVLRVRQGRPGDAVADLKAAIVRKPKAYQAYANLAYAYRDLKQLDLALAELDHAVQLEPTLAHLFRLRARLHLERQEPTLALQDFTQSIQHEQASSPYLPDDHVDRGWLLLRDQQYTAALASFDAALHLRRDHALAQRLRSEALLLLRRYSEAIEAFDHYLENGKPLESVYRGRGLARAELGKYPGAIEDFTRALELRPSSAVQAYRGWAHLVCDAPKLALRDFQLAIDLDPKNGDAYNGRGFVRASLGQPTEAVQDAAMAVRHGPRSPRLLYNAARICAQCAGHEEQALVLIQEALALLPANQRGKFWTTFIRADAALRAIRRHPQFLQLEAEMSPRN
jgi:serine/threonine protein kinase/tetratricopeptide (TPR) repeat protein